MTNAMEVVGLRKEYDGFSLDDVSFNVPMGCITGFIGENGAGKTTTIKALLNLIIKDGGKVRIFGMDAEEGDLAIKERIGVVFDGNCIPENLQIGDVSNVLGRIHPNWDCDLFLRTCHRFGLPGGKIIKGFSRGMKTKLNLACALAHRPDLLILDEVTSGLDPVAREDVLDILLEFIQDDRHSVLISSHITSDLDKIADQLVFIHGGSIVLSDYRDRLMDTMGILKCGTGEVNDFSSHGTRIRRHAYGCEILLEDRFDFLQKFPDAVVDPVNIENIMLFYIKGEEL